jgi:hypothetical protein
MSLRTEPKEAATVRPRSSRRRFLDPDGKRRNRSNCRRGKIIGTAGRLER